MAFGIWTGKYKFASLVAKRNPLGTMKVLNMDIKDFRDQFIFSVILKRERNLSHIQIHTSSATDLKSTLFPRAVPKKSQGHWKRGQAGWLLDMCMIGEKREEEGQEMEGPWERDWKNFFTKINSNLISMSKPNVAYTNSDPAVLLGDNTCKT